MLGYLLFAVIGIAVFLYFAMPIFRVRNAKPDTDVIRWINGTHGVLIAINNKNPVMFAGAPANAANRAREAAALKEWWDVTDTASLNASIAWLMNEGHRVEYAQDKKEVAAWDYSRALSLLSSGYLAGYVTREEALARSLDLAKICQREYRSWDEFMEAYFKGYELWAGESSALRRKSYNGLKMMKHSPYQLPWNLALKQDWK